MSFKTLLNKTCTIKSASYQTQENSGQQNIIYTDFAVNIPCRLRTRQVSERRYSSPAYQKATHALYLTERSLPQNDFCIVIDGKNYNVVGSLSLGGAGRYQCLYLERAI
ncbi:MAG: hypothetical protein II972_02410 [Elusimicrobiaceae bacterium]|nr:hypothetical protein [Elusimicrobiaceae bacterium]